MHHICGTYAACLRYLLVWDFDATRAPHFCGLYATCIYIYTHIYLRHIRQHLSGVYAARRVHAGLVLHICSIYANLFCAIYAACMQNEGRTCATHMRLICYIIVACLWRMCVIFAAHVRLISQMPHATYVRHIWGTPETGFVGIPPESQHRRSARKQVFCHDVNHCLNQRMFWSNGLRGMLMKNKKRLGCC